MLKLIAILAIGAFVGIALGETGHARPAKAIGFTVVTILIAFAALIIFGLLFNT